MRSALIPFAILIAVSACAAPSSAPLPLRPPAPVVTDAAFEAAALASLNAARTDPQAYAERVRRFRQVYRDGRIEYPGEIPVETQEGVAAVDEAIAFLERQAPLAPVTRSAELDRAAAGHAADQGRSGGDGHAGSDGSNPFDRMRRNGRWTAMGEAIAYGPHRPEDVVMQLIIDDGVPDRGHRTTLFNPTYQLIGVGCGPHPRWRTVCVFDLARP